MHRLARLELEAVELAAEQSLQVLARARTQASRKIHRDHRPMKRYHPGEIDQRVEQESRVGETDEDFRRARDRFEVEQRQQPPASVTAARGKDRLDFGVGEIFLKLARPPAIVARQDARTRERALRNLDSIAHRAEHVDAALEMLPFDRRRRCDDRDGVARFERVGFYRFVFHSFTLARSESYQMERANAHQHRRS